MDDPWGSPWATNDSNFTLEPPPRASTNPGLPGRTLTRDRSSSSISPWATIQEDDWTAADSSLALPPAAATASAWSGWGGENGNGFNSSQTSLPARAREGSLGPPSPSVWPGASSPGLGPGRTLSRRSSSKSLFRQPSPDPWAAEVSQNRLSLPAAVHISAEQAAFSTLDRHEEVDEDRHDAKSKEEEAGSIPGTEAEKIRDLEATPVPEQVRGVEVQPDRHAVQEPVEQGHDDEDHADSPSASRHSSISDESEHEERLDSPITSMDEDSKDRHPISRRASAKAQAVADMDHALATKTDGMLLVPDPASGRQRSTSRSVSIRSARTEDASDFGDFEDAEEFVPSRQPSFSGSPRPTTSKGAHLRPVSEISLLNAAAATANVTSPIPEEASSTSSRFQELRDTFGLVKFTPDLELVDKLFDVERLDKEQPSAKDYSLDVVDGIIKDSFTTVSERKTWYRISRPGTMRKHDMGDDENYRRVTWAGSKVRQDATKIVRRWMEEDTYTGRPAMGGGSMIKGGGFNWDSRAEAREPLSFDQIFGKRKSVQPPKAVAAPIPRPLSLQPQPTALNHSRASSVGVKSLPPRSPLSIPAPPPGPAFGWSSGANDSETPASSRPSGQYARQSLEVSSLRSGTSRATSIHEPESRNSLQLAPPSSVPPPQPPKLKTAVEAIKNDDEDDEDWGEMVASPANDSRPVSAVFDSSMNGSMANLSTTSPGPAPIVPTPDTRTTLEAVSSKLQDDQPTETKEDQIPPTTVAAAPANIWDFSTFDSKTVAPAIPPTTTSKPEFSFDTPLQSPTLTIPSRTGSPASSQIPKPPTPTIPSQPGSPAPFQIPKPPTPPAPFRPQHASKSSFSLVRPSPLHNVITPKPSSPKLASPVHPSPKATSPRTAVPINTPPRTVTFVEDEDPEETAAARRVVDNLPDLSYMLR